jgi:hypothetical protein
VHLCSFAVPLVEVEVEMGLVPVVVVDYRLVRVVRVFLADLVVRKAAEVRVVEVVVLER